MTNPDEFSWTKPAHLAGVCVFLFFGLSGGLVGQRISLPLPFLFGGIISTMLIAWFLRRRGTAWPFPEILRRSCVGVIGTLIGSAFSPALLTLLPGLTLSLLALLIYMPIALWMGFTICRYIGGYDPTTAFYASMPGGLIDAVEIGSQSGGDTQTLALSHLFRILNVVMLVPLLFWIWSGGPVGSSAGQTLDQGPSGLIDVLWIVLITAIGLWIGLKIHLPAHHLMGPLIVSALAHGFGVLSVASPDILLFSAQLVVGVGLACQFTGKTGPGLVKIWFCMALTVLCVLILGGGLALLLEPLSPLSIEALFLSFAPGGVTEMGLIALSLSISPVLVVAHHMCRIFLVVLIAALASKHMRIR